MGIYVSIEHGSDQKSKGDLLEKISKKLLEAHDYEVETEVRKTGMELDLLCQNRTNPARKMYVECKAHSDDSKIPAGVITNLSGRLNIMKYQEAWLISTSELNKEAKGLVDTIQSSEDSKRFTFYTPGRLEKALQSASVICSKEIAFQKVKELVQDDTKLGETHLLISCFGDFWLTEFLKGGKIDGVVFCHAKNGEIIIDEDVIENIQKLDFKFQNYDLGTVFRLLDPNDKTIEGRRLRGANLNEDYILRAANQSGNVATVVRGRTASIDDLFVYPDMEVIGVNETKSSPNLVSSKKILSSNDIRAWLVLGSDLSGKTVLSFILQRRFSEAGQVAIRLDSRNLKKIQQTTIDKAVSDAFRDQYNVTGIPSSTIKAYIEAIRNDIVLIIDDFDKVETKSSSNMKLISSHLERTYSKVIIFANSSKELEFTTSNEGQEALKKFKIYRLLQLGHAKRDELIENWITVNSEELPDKAGMLAKKNDFANRINIAVGTNYLPTYPFYTLAILEMLESGSKAQLQGSEYAALYGHLVNHALLSNKVKVPDLGFYNTYLSHLAQELHKRKTTTISVADIESFFTTYLHLMGLSKSCTSVHQKLVDSRVLRIDDELYAFNLPYYRYYFFAKYLSDNIETTEVKHTIKKLVDNLYEDDNANTVVFLVHHSKNPEIIDVIVDKAKSQFKSVRPQTLVSSEVEGINALITEDIKFILKDGSATEHRKKRLKRQDSYERKQKDSEKKESILDVYGQTTSAFRTIDVLGKITSNYYGELNANRKNLIMKELYELGFRSLRTFLESFDSYTGALRDHVATKIDDKDITSDTEREKVVNQIIYSFTHIITYSFIKRVSDSVISPDLMMTIEEVLSKENVPSAKLTSLAIKLNFPRGLEKNKSEITKLYDDLSSNSLSRDLLRFLILEHLYKFEVDYQDRQSICNQLKIDVAVVNRKRLKAASQRDIN